MGSFDTSRSFFVIFAGIIHHRGKEDTEDFINISGNPSIGEAAMNAWRMDRRFMGNLLDAVAPDCLVVCFGNSQANSSWDGKNALF